MKVFEEKKCPTCGAEFKPKNSYQKYCSRKCYDRANYLENRAEKLAHQRAYYAARKAASK